VTIDGIILVVNGFRFEERSDDGHDLILELNEVPERSKKSQ
jgi:hypothetical protein